MAVVQSTYLDQPGIAYAGMVANGETANIISRTNVDAAGLSYGKAAFRSGDTGVTGSIVAGVGNFLGFTVAHEAIGIVAGQTADLYPQYENVPILTEGPIWVTAGEDITLGTQVYITSGGAIVDTVGSNTIATGWFFDTTALNAGLVRIAKR